MRRLGSLFATLVCGSAVLALVLGFLFGSSVARSLSVGWYVTGSILLIGGFFVGNRGPARPTGAGWNPFSLQRWSRWATLNEQRESLSLSAVLIILGFVLIVLGAASDPRHTLF